MISKLMMDMIQYNSHDQRRINHALKVHSYAKINGKKENLDKLLEADLIVNAQEKFITEYAFRNAVNNLFVTSAGKAVADIAL